MRVRIGASIGAGIGAGQHDEGWGEQAGIQEYFTMDYIGGPPRSLDYIYNE